MRTISITDRMILYYLLLSISGLTLIGAIFYNLAKDALIERTFDQLTSVRVVKKRQIESFFKDRINELDHLSQMPEIRSILLPPEHHPDNPGSGRNKKNSDVLQSFINHNQYFDGIYLESINSKKTHIISKSNTPSANPYPLLYKGINSKITEKIDNRKHIFEDQSVFKDFSNQIYLFLVSPVFDDNKLMGYCTLLLSFDGINKIMLENNPENGLGNSGESYLVGPDHLMRSRSRFNESSIYQIPVNTYGAKQALNGKEGTSVFKDYRGIPVLSSYDKIDFPGLHWVVLAEIDLDEANVPIIEFRNYIILIIAIISIATFIVTYIISKRITNPIKKLTVAASKIGEGTFDEVLEIKTNDEIEILSNTFNKMSGQLKAKEAELQQEKTKSITAVMDVQESERERLSRELHDGIGQSFIALKLQLENVEYEDPDITNAIIEDVKSKIDNMIQDIRNISNDLMPTVLKEFGLTTAIRNMCHDLSVLLDYKIELNINLRQKELSDKLNIYIFRILQEGLNNVIKHADPDNVEIDVNRNGSLLNIKIIDDGIGFDLNSDFTKRGNGLYYMRERVNLLNGDFALDSKINNGTIIDITIPLDRNE